MFSIEDLKNVCDNVSINELINTYDNRQFSNRLIEEDSFNLFLEELYRQLNNKTIFFSKAILSEIVKNIIRENFREDFIKDFNLLCEISKPKGIIDSECQMNKLSFKYKELSHDEKMYNIFQIIFGKFDLKVQKQFLRLLKRFDFNSSMDLLVLMTLIKNWHDSNRNSLEELQESLKSLVSINDIKSESISSLTINTKFGDIPFSYANEELNIYDMSLLKLGKCHYAVSKFLKELPKLFGAYYYIPNYFGGFIEHSVLINYDKNYVYDLSHNIALPLEFFHLYYGNPSFIISGKDFEELNHIVESEYGFELHMPYIEEVKRRLKK